MEHESSLRGSLSPGPPPREGEQRILAVLARSEEDLLLVHRRARQVGALLQFDVSQQTQIVTATADALADALRRCGAAKLEFSLRPGAPGALSIAVRDGGPGLIQPELGGEEGRMLRILRRLMDDVQLQRSSEGTTIVLSRSLPPEAHPLTDERVKDIRDHLSSCVPKTLIEELREQNRELRKTQQELVASELLLRRYIQHNALLSKVAAVLEGSEPLAQKLQTCADQIRAHLDVGGVLIWTAEGSGGVRLAASAGFAQADLPSTEVGEVLTRLVGEGTTYATQSVGEDLPSAHRAWASCQQLKACAAHPLRSEGRGSGAVVIYTKEAIALDAIGALALVAGQISMGLERLQRLEERERLLASEHEARLKAERAIRMREHLLAIVAHDLRNPLSAIVTATALLKGVPGLSEELRWRKHLQTVTNSVERMNRLILDLLDVASIEAGRLSFELRPHSVAQLIQELLDQYAPVAEAHGLRLEAHDESFAEIASDRVRFLQALFNLLENAFKFSLPGGLVTLRAFRRGSEVVFAVADGGPGIAEADRARVFEPYWQAKPEARMGLGLGLSIAKGIVEAHHGRISFESAESTGTTFFVSVPALAERTQEARLAP